MKISIITACYNAAKTLRDAMESVVAQGLGIRDQGLEIEYIVVDGGSTDGTVDVIREFERDSAREARAPRVRVKWVSEKDRGMYDAVNKGIRMATGEVIGILNADDVLDGEDVLEKVAREFQVSSVKFVPAKSKRTF